MPNKRRKEQYTNSITPPIYQSASYYFDSQKDVVDGLHTKSVPFGRYGRYDNPTWMHVEEELMALCQSESALVFSSGMAAHTTAFLSLLKEGDHVVLPSESYRQVRNVFKVMLPKFGVNVHEFSIIDPDAFAENIENMPTAPRLVHLEMPSSPHMYLTDIERIRSIVGESTVITMDSSFAPPPNFDALKWGVDISLFSGTKYLSGHGDIVVGCAAGRKDLMEELKWYRDTTGSVCDGRVAYLLIRSLHSLELRMKHLNEQTQLVADYLSGNAEVSRVYYTGLDSHPHFALGEKYLNGHGGVITFELPRSESEVAEFVDRLEVPYMASNFGAPQTLVEQSTFFTYYEYDDAQLSDVGVSRGTVRLAMGYTNSAAEVIADIEQALR